MYNLENHQIYYAFVNGDVLMNFYYDKSEKWHMYVPFDTNDVVYYKDSSNGNAGPALENGVLLQNSSYLNYYTYYPENTSTNYVKDNDMVYSETGQDKSYFALDTNISKAILSNSSLSTVYDNEKNRFLITTDGSSTHTTTSIDGNFDKQWNAIYKTSFENTIYEINTDENPKWYEEHDIVDANNKARYGVASPYLYLNKGTE